MRGIVRIVTLVLLCNPILSQNEADVLRYSTTDIFGSARFEAMAGSFGGLGADISAIQINPASMGRFSSSRASFSMNASFLGNKGLFNAVETQSNDSKYAVSAVGAVITTDISHRNTGRRYNQITLGYTRLKNFSNKRKYEGQNFNSLLEVLAADGFGIDPDYIYDDRPFTTGLAYDVYAVDYDAGTGEYIPRLTMGDMYHKREISTDGGIGEFHIGYSENYMNKLYYGASLGIRRVNYEERYTHNERLLEPAGVSLLSFDYDYHQKTSGTGLNLKLGLLYLVTDELRLGLAFETPTVFRLKDAWTNDMTALHDYGVETIKPEFIPHGNYEYRIKSPMKLRGSFAYILGMKTAINVDLEMARLPGGRLRSSSEDEYLGIGYDFKIENEEISRQFRTILNTRIGVEHMLFNDFYIRGGLALLPQPYKKEIGNVNTMNMTYSVGVGWENRFFYVDASYRLLQLHSDYYAFDPSRIENKTEFKSNLHSIVITAGLKF